MVGATWSCAGAAAVVIWCVMSRRMIVYVLDLSRGRVLAACDSQKTAERKAEAHVRRTGCTTVTARLVMAFQAE